MLVKKMIIEEFLRAEFTPESAPHPTTIVRRIKAGIYNGVKEGGKWYILKQMTTGDSRADQILAKHGTA